ncbi:DNA helicase [Bertholletia excelsa]
MDERHEEVDDEGGASSDSFTEESDADDPLLSSEDNELNFETCLTEEEIDELIAELLDVESKAAEAQESLEDESLARVELEVRKELAESYNGEDLEKAVVDEMETFKEEWEAVLDELEIESAHLLEQLEGAGVELPSLYKWIERQAPNGCSTEAWRKRTHWVGSQMDSDITEYVSCAEKYLQIHRPVRRRHGKTLEEGASGYLGKKLSIGENKDVIMEEFDVDWCSFNKIVSVRSSDESTSFGTKHWASVYLASTPQQAAELGLKFPGVDEVEEIDDIDGSSTDPFVADAVANETELALSETHKKNFRKVKEEDDANITKKLQLHLKRRRHRNRCSQEAMQREVSSIDKLTEVNLDILGGKTDRGGKGVIETNKKDTLSQDLMADVHEKIETSNGIEERKLTSSGASSEISDSALPGPTEHRGSKRLHDDEGRDVDKKKVRAEVIDIDHEAHSTEGMSPICGSNTVEDLSGLPVRQDGMSADSIPVQNSMESFHCTACGELAVEVHKHPVLRVIVCRPCKYLLEAKMQVKDPDCSECYCVWCGGNTELIRCGSCELLFCTTCMKRNFGKECLLKVDMPDWQCCQCMPSMLQELTLQLEKAIKLVDSIVSSSDSDSDDSDGDISFAISSKRKQKKKIRRILDDAELGEETKRKIAIEKERQERLKCLEAQFTSKSIFTSASNCIGNVSEGGSVEVLGDALTGYIVNVVREKGEEAVRIPPSISGKLKVHQIAGIRFMWENIIQSVTKVKSGDKGLGCILAHTMGLGKTFQVIAFLYSAMRSVDIGLKTALIVTPVSVLHNWRQEFMKWRPLELKRLRVFMLEDVSRERRAELLAKWRAKGGVFLIGYAAFRNLSLGKHVKDRHAARDICYALQFLIFLAHNDASINLMSMHGRTRIHLVDQNNDSYAESSFILYESTSKAISSPPQTSSNPSQSFSYSLSEPAISSSSPRSMDVPIGLFVPFEAEAGVGGLVVDDLAGRVGSSALKL